MRYYVRWLAATIVVLVSVAALFAVEWWLLETFGYAHVMGAVVVVCAAAFARLFVRQERG
jgi:hypothetical protein